jgi:group I intron endonuclease
MRKENKTNCGIYKITNLIPNERTVGCKVYVGSSANIKSRKYEHFRLLKNNKHINKHLQNSFNMYGLHNFKFELIKSIEKIEDKKLLKEELLKWENLELDKYKKEDGTIDHDRCYNFLPTAGSNLGIKVSQETKEKISKNNKRGMLGKICSKETRLKLSKAKKGNTYWLGKNHSEKSKKKMSKLHKNKIVSEETKNKLREVNLGKKQSEETVKKKVEKWRKKVVNLTTNITFSSIKEASSFYGIADGSISRVCKGTLKSAGGFMWSYVIEGEK